MAVDIGLVVLGFLFGSIPTGVILAWWKGRVDLRQVGSGNIGATNVARALGKGMGALTMACDIAKGIIPVVIARRITGDATMVVALTALAAFLGHLYSPFVKFKGGKGVAVAVGVVAGFNPMVGGIEFSLWAILVALTRVVSIASLSAALALPFVLLLFKAGLPFILLGVVICILIFYRHRENIGRLMAGTERGFR